MSTLKVTVGDHDRLDQQTNRRLEAAAAGEDIEDAQPVLNFATYGDLSRLLSPKNLELLDVVSAHEPDSIRETADLVDRDYKQVHRNLSELEAIGVIEFEESGPGAAKAPTLAYDGLEIDIPFAEPDPSQGTAIP